MSPRTLAILAAAAATIAMATWLSRRSAALPGTRLEGANRPIVPDHTAAAEVPPVMTGEGTRLGDPPSAERTPSLHEPSPEPVPLRAPAGPGTSATGKKRFLTDTQAEHAAKSLAESLYAYELHGACVRDGVAAVLPILERACAIREERGLPPSGALLFGRANAHLAQGKDGVEDAEKLFVEAILAMEAITPDDRLGFPRLHWFVLGSNIGGYGGEDHRYLNCHSWGVPRSGMNPGVTPFLWHDWKPELLPWLGTLAKRTDRPELAMAAGIWTHATGAHSNATGGAWPGCLPPASAKLLARMIPGTEIEGLAWPALCGVFERAVEFGVAREDRVAGNLVLEREKCGRIRRERDLEWRTRGVEYALAPEVYWSLREEVVLRFDTVDTERARRLRALAEKLLEY